MDETKVIIWIFLACIFSYVSWNYGEVQILCIFEGFPLSVTDFLFTLWIMIGFQITFGHAHISGILQSTKWIIECLIGKYWCEEKGWWILCSHDCAKCQIQIKRRITLWQARIFCIGYGTVIVVIFLIGVYIILNPAALWEVI